MLVAPIAYDVRERPFVHFGQWTTFIISPSGDVALFAFQPCLFLSRFIIISAQPSSSSASSSRSLPDMASPPPLEGRIVTVGVDATFSRWNCDCDAFETDFRFSSAHCLEPVGVRLGLCSCGIVDTGRYRGAIPMLLRSDGAMDGV